MHERTEVIGRFPREFSVFPRMILQSTTPFFPEKFFYKEKSGLFYVLSLCLYIVHCIHYTWFTYKSVLQSTLYYLLLVIVTMQLNSLQIFSYYWTSQGMGWVKSNYGEYWSVTSANKMNKANQFVIYLIFKNFGPLSSGTLRVGFAKQLRPTSNVCNSFWEEQIQSFISKNQFNCLLVTFIVLNYISIRFLYLNNFFSSQKCDFILWVEWWGKNSHRMINGWW